MFFLLYLLYQFDIVLYRTQSFIYFIRSSLLYLILIYILFTPSDLNPSFLKDSIIYFFVNSLFSKCITSSPNYWNISAVSIGSISVFLNFDKEILSQHFIFLLICFSWIIVTWIVIYSLIATYSQKIASPTYRSLSSEIAITSMHTLTNRDSLNYRATILLIKVSSHFCWHTSPLLHKKCTI
jgi:hypothetical protein